MPDTKQADPLDDLPEITAGISWGGFKLCGDIESVTEVQRLMQEAYRSEYFRKEMLTLRAALSKSEDELRLALAMPSAPAAGAPCSFLIAAGGHVLVYLADAISASSEELRLKNRPARATQLENCFSDLARDIIASLSKEDVTLLIDALRALKGFALPRNQPEIDALSTRLAKGWDATQTKPG